MSSLDGVGRTVFLSLLFLNTFFLEACQTSQGNKSAGEIPLARKDEKPKAVNGENAARDPNYNLRIVDFEAYSGDQDKKLVAFHRSVLAIDREELIAREKAEFAILQKIFSYRNSLSAQTEEGSAKIQEVDKFIDCDLSMYHLRFHVIKTPLILAQSIHFHPIGEFKVDKRTFYLSKILLGGERKLALLYTKNDDAAMLARLLYKSRSDGEWRVAPYLDEQGSFAKGGDRHYTQENKPVLGITLLLEEFERSREMTTEISYGEDGERTWLFKTFSGDVLTLFAAYKNYISEVVQTDLGGEISEVLTDIVKCEPGKCFATTSNEEVDIGELLAKVEGAFHQPSLAGFMPDFSHTPLLVYTVNHMFLGEVNVEVYPGVLAGRPVLWHMASDGEQRIWIDRINFADVAISSFGVAKEFLNSGVLTNKVLEYNNQVEKLKSSFVLERFSHDKNSKKNFYVDISAFLDELYPIKVYRLARNYARRAIN